MRADALHAKFAAARKALSAALIERDDEIDLALTALLAFALAAAMTLLAKQTLASTLSEPAAASQFASQLQYYTRVPDNEAGWPGWLEPFGRLVQKSNMLTYGNQSAGYVLVALTGLIWLAAAVRGWRFRLGDDRGDEKKP